MGRAHGSLSLPGAMGDGGHVSGTSRGHQQGLPGSSPPSRQAAGWDHWGSKGVLLCSPLRLPPGEEMHISLGAGKAWNVILFLLFFFFPFFPPKISSLPEAGGQGGVTSARLVQRSFAPELLSQQCSIKGSLCPGWDKGTSLIKLAQPPLGNYKCSLNSSMARR